MRSWCAIVVVVGSMACAMALSSCGGGAEYFHFTPEDPLIQYWSVAAADLNGDGKTDLVTSYSYDAGQRQGFIAVYLQDAVRPGTFLAPAKFEVGANPVALTVGDLNGDAKPDIVVVNDEAVGTTLTQNSVSVFLQDSSGAGRFTTSSLNSTGKGPVQVSIADLNNDGHADLAIADEGGVSLLFQNAGSPGTFAARTTINTGVNTFAVATADLDGDGLPDVVTSSNSGLQVWLQDPTSAGAFLTPVTYAAGSVVQYIAVADLNRDGRPDLAVANGGVLENRSDATVSVLLQSASRRGTFLSPSSYATARDSEVVAVGDLNGDGNLDLAVSNWAGVGGGEGVASVLLQDATQPGRFLPATNYGGNTGIGSWVAVADLNEDDKTDLVFVDSATVSIRFQDPARAGTFLGRNVVAE